MGDQGHAFIATSGKNIKAFNIGRKLALEPRLLPPKPAPETWLHLVTNKSKILRKTRLRSAGPTPTASRSSSSSAMKQLPDLPERTKYDLTLRLYDLTQYADVRFAKRYVEAVRAIYRRDSAEKGYLATQAVIWNLAKAMLIKDEPYVAYLLTRYEKKQRDLTKYGVDVANGDRPGLPPPHQPGVQHRKFRLRLKITTTDWQLHLVRHMKWWRSLPGWHARETTFRDWYLSLLDRVSLNDANYAASVEVLKCTEDVTGYREVRYPKMDAAKARAEAALTRVPRVEVEIRRGVLESMGRKTTRV